MIVLPVRIIMSPTSSSRPLAGRKARSATVRTNSSPLEFATPPLVGGGAEGYATACMWHKREPRPELAATSVDLDRFRAELEDEIAEAELDAALGLTAFLPQPMSEIADDPGFEVGRLRDDKTADRAEPHADDGSLLAGLAIRSPVAEAHAQRIRSLETEADELGPVVQI